MKRRGTYRVGTLCGTKLALEERGHLAHVDRLVHFEEAAEGPCRLLCADLFTEDCL